MGRKWGTLSYLLVERWRVYSLDDVLVVTADNSLTDFTDRDKMYFRALMGGDWLHDSEIIPRGKQCDRPRYMPSDEVKTISDQFDKMTFDDLLQHYSDEKMANSFIYKFQPHYKM